MTKVRKEVENSTKIFYKNIKRLMYIQSFKRTDLLKSDKKSKEKKRKLNTFKHQ